MEGEHVRCAPEYTKFVHPKEIRRRQNLIKNAKFSKNAEPRRWSLMATKHKIQGSK